MGLRKGEITILAILFALNTLLTMLNSAKVVGRSLGTTLYDIAVYFILCYLYINRISAILMVILCLCLITVIIALPFYDRPRQWYFESPVIFGINTMAMVAFVLMNLTNDHRSTFLFSAFIATMSVFIPYHDDKEKIYRIYAFVVSITVYILLSAFHVKQFWDRNWKVVAIASLSLLTMVLGVLLRIYWNSRGKLFTIISIINCFISLVPWLWLTFAPKIKAWWQASGEREMIEHQQYNFLEMAGLPTRFTIKELEEATENFRTPIGEGASGAVYKGTLPDGSNIAVKRIKWQPSGETEFRTEMTIIASRQHMNLVRILGFGVSIRGDRYLIYPFIENGSLNLWLFQDDKKRSQLTWALRYAIAIDVAKALAYLHHECHHRILHLDIKPANILLHGDFRALLSDFGISKLIGKDQSSVMTKARGTVGYLAPEMLVPNAISTKSDVYSYGMVLMELISGRRNLTMVMDGDFGHRRSSYLPKIAREKMMQGKIMEVVDKSLIMCEAIREEEVMMLTRLALWCIQENPMQRPSMIEVVDILEGRRPVDVPPESSMFVVNFFDMVPQCSTSSGERHEETSLMSSNNLSVSIQSGT